MRTFNACTRRFGARWANVTLFLTTLGLSTIPPVRGMHRTPVNHQPYGSLRCFLCLFHVPVRILAACWNSEGKRLMRIKNYLQGFLISVLATGLVLPVVRAADSAPPGTIVGIVTNSAKLPVARATVTAIKVGGGGIRATVSGSDGVYSFPDLPAGAWSLTSQVDGYPAAVVPSLNVVANQATRYDIVMAGAPTAAAAPLLAAAPAPAPVNQHAG